MPYKLHREVIEDKKLITIVKEGQHCVSLFIATFTVDKSNDNIENVDSMVSYLNQIEQVEITWKKVASDLLIAGLSRSGLTVAQEKVANMLGFPGLAGFIEENFKSKQVESLKEVILDGGEGLYKQE